jgi:hypothetical protein
MEAYSVEITKFVEEHGAITCCGSPKRGTYSLANLLK